MDLRRLPLFITPPQNCSYLPGQESINLLADPRVSLDVVLYSELVANGFRRSGNLIYRPYCPFCQACIPVRIPVDQFVPRRSQRRTLATNRSVTVHFTPAELQEQQFQLYCRYLAARHPGGDIPNPTVADYLQFLTNPLVDTGFYEFREGQNLLGVAVIDHLTHGLSAVYTFFDPTLPTRSLGVYGILWSVAECQRRGLPYLYLGYWISQCRKMRYKEQYQPLEIYWNNQWQPFYDFLKENNNAFPSTLSSG